MKRKWFSWSVFCCGLLGSALAVTIVSWIADLLLSFEADDVVTLFLNGPWFAMLLFIGAIMLVSYLFGMLLRRIFPHCPPDHWTGTAWLLLVYSLVCLTVLLILRFACPDLPHLILYGLHNPTFLFFGIYIGLSESLGLDAAIELASIGCLIAGMLKEYRTVPKRVLFVGAMVLFASATLFVLLVFIWRQYTFLI